MKPIIPFLLYLGLITPLFSQKKKAPPSLQFQPVHLHSDNNEGVAVTDYNNDGKLDVSAGAFWYAAPDWKQRPVRELGTFGDDYMTNNGEHPRDVDGDGWVDIVAGEFKGTEVAWFKNPGAEAHDNGELWQRHLLLDTGLGSNEANFLQDLDGDGTPEFVTNSWIDKNPFMAFRFVGEKLEPLEIGAASSISNGHGAGFGDIDGDGDTDIVFKNGWYENPGADGAGEAGEWALHPDFTLPHASCPILVFDVNGDGKNDLVWGDGHNYGLYWEEQKAADPDGTTNWRTHLIDKKFSQVHAMALADLDGDEVPELITGKRFKAHSGRDPGSADPLEIYYFKWDVAAGSFQKFTASSADVGTGLQIRVADMDGNGLPDIITAGKSGTHILLNQGLPK